MNWKWILPIQTQSGKLCPKNKKNIINYLRTGRVDIVEQLGGAGEACQAHNLKVGGSKPPPARLLSGS